MFSTFDRLFNFAIHAIVFFTAVIIIAVFWFTATYLFNSFIVYFLIIVFGCLLGIIAGAYLYVILTLPFQLSKKFDAIKNKVALQYYASVNDFQNEIATLIMEIFSYPGVRVDGGVFEFKGADKLTVNVDFDLDIFTDLSIKNMVKRSHGMKAFYIPIHLGNQNLGSMIVFSRGLTLPILRMVLLDFESYMLDDQLMHVQFQQGK